MFSLAFVFHLVILPVGAMVNRKDSKHVSRDVYGASGVKPKYQVGPKTIESCTWWLDNDRPRKCEDLAADFSITLENLLIWNPSIKSSCANLASSRSYCVEASIEANKEAKTPTVGTFQTGSPTQAKPTTTLSNGIQTPKPVQANMIKNCNKFHLRKDGEFCQDIAELYSISVEDFYRFNPGVGSTCGKLWKDAYVCVGTLNPSTPTLSQTTSPTQTKPSNGIETPKPIQPGMTPNCKKFYMRKEDEFCADIASVNGISLEDFYRWNSGLGSDCTKLWVKSYVCVAVL